MRKLTCILVALVLLLSSPVLSGDPIDGNDRLFKVASDAADYYCTSVESVYDAWMCDVMMAYDCQGWWDCPW